MPHRQAACSLGDRVSDAEGEPLAVGLSRRRHRRRRDAAAHGVRRRWRRAIARPAWCCPRRLSPHAAGASGQLHDGVDGVGPVPPLHVLHCGGGDRAIILHGGGGDVVRDELRLGLVELVDRFVLSVMSPWRSRSAARSSRTYTAACRTFFLSICRRALSALPTPKAPALSAGCSSPNFGAGHLCGHSCCGRDPTQ